MQDPREQRVSETRGIRIGNVEAVGVGVGPGNGADVGIGVGV